MYVFFFKDHYWQKWTKLFIICSKRPVSKVKYFNFYILCLLSAYFLTGSRWIILNTSLSYIMFFAQFPFVFSIKPRFTIACRELLTHILLYLLRNEKFAEGNSFGAHFRHEEVTDICKVQVCYVLLNYFIFFCFFHHL